MLHGLDLFVHLFCFPSVVTHEAEPDDECDEELYAGYDDPLHYRCRAAVPAYCICDQRVDHTAGAHVDDHLNEKGYIVPGLGDAGDRIFGTK